MEKKKYYVSLASKEISKVEFGNNNDFIIHASDDEVKILRAKMDHMHKAEMGSFWRAHVPIMPYHNDEANDLYDKEIMAVFQMIYDLGDKQTQSNMNDMGVLTDQQM